MAIRNLHHKTGQRVFPSVVWVVGWGIRMLRGEATAAPDGGTILLTQLLHDQPHWWEVIMAW